MNYSSSRLTRGSSLQDVSPSLGSSHSRLTRQSSLDKERPSLYQPKRNTTFTPGHYEQSYQDQIRSSRSATRHVKEEKKRRPINCNKVRAVIYKYSPRQFSLDEFPLLDQCYKTPICLVQLCNDHMFLIPPLFILSLPGVGRLYKTHWKYSML